MSKSLIIAEKPSVANDIARALGGLKKIDDHFENEKVHHLVRRWSPGRDRPPEGAEVKRGKWNIENLPVLPDHFDLSPIEKHKGRLQLLKKLVKRPDVTEVINACDAGREGELIFRNTMRWTGAKKPTRRLWLQSMTAESIRNGFANLRSEKEMQPLADAASSRAESDWLVGINATRALTSFNSRTGGFQKTAAGRVQTPTLAILATREEKIRAFKARPYFEVHAMFQVQAGEYAGRWFDENFKKDQDEDARAERIWTRERATAIEKKCTGKTGEITEEKKPTTQASPLLYDLTTLQREANNRFGLHARRTLQIAQALYEKHKVLTYPRTDSRYLPEDNLAQVRKVMGGFDDPSLATHAKKALRNEWVKPTKRVFNNAKVSDHHAIIPTGASPARLDEFERKIFEMVARRTIAVFYPPAQFEVTTRITRVEGEPFKTDGKIIVDPGWLAVYGKEATGEDEAAIVPVTDGESAKLVTIEVRENETKPPPRFNEATLLSAMEGAGKLVEDEELREAMRERGLGTPATRAQVIEGLIADGYIERRGKELVVMAKGLSLITLLRNLHTDVLSTPELTGEWEFRLKEMAHGRLDRQRFMTDIRELTREIVERVRGFRGETIEGEYSTIDAKCPNCGNGPIKEDYKTFRCKNCDWLMWKTMASRQFDPEEVGDLLTKGRVGPLQGFRSKMGRSFEAIVKLGEDKKPVFDFGEGINGAAITIDPAVHEALGLCPICQKGQVYVLGPAYACERAVAATKECTFRVGKVILQREIPKEQVIKLINTGKTDLLPKFISKKGRPFAAHLKLGNGKIGFEFAERVPKAKKSPVRKPAVA